MKMKSIFFYISDLIIEVKYRANDDPRVIFLPILGSFLEYGMRKGR